MFFLWLELYAYRTVIAAGKWFEVYSKERTHNGVLSRLKAGYNPVSWLSGELILTRFYNNALRQYLRINITQ